MTERSIGGVILQLDGISLAFGGVKALTDISFDVREHEVRAIIGPNGAGKSSMLNVINGVYHPQHGTITFHGKVRRGMDPHDAAAQGIARTFQNIALFRGMTVLDNIMTGRNLKMKSTFLEQAIWFGRARREELENRMKVEEVIDFLEIQHIRKTPVGRLPVRAAEARRARARAGGGADDAAARRADGRHERRGEAGHVPLRARRQRAVRDDDRPDRARHGRGDGHLRSRGRARLRQEDRRRPARRGAQQQGGDRSVSGCGALKAKAKSWTTKNTKHTKKPEPRLGFAFLRAFVSLVVQDPGF
jgi:branched-chain amino acid transport system ATP-binding protein